MCKQKAINWFADIRFTNPVNYSSLKLALESRAGSELTMKYRQILKLNTDCSSTDKTRQKTAISLIQLVEIYTIKYISMKTYLSHITPQQEDVFNNKDVFK